MGRLALRPALRAYAHARPIAEEAGTTPGINSCDFDGVDEQIELAATQMISSGSAFTISLWMKLNTTSYTDRAVTFKTNESQPLSIGMSTNSNIGDFFWGGGNTLPDYTPWGRLRVQITGALQYNTWYHLVLVYGGSSPESTSSWSAYVNGSAETVALGASASFIGSNNNTFGSRRGSWYMDGKLDNVSIWDSQLSAGAVSSIYNSGSCIPLDAARGSYSASDVATLAHWWRLGADTGDSLSASGVLDTIGNVHGTATNMELADFQDTDVPS